MKLVDKIKITALNFPGYKTKKKIVVIESDDWGSIRMASKESREFLRSMGHSISSSPYHELDGLEKDEDIEILAEVMDSVVTPNGGKAKITMNNSTANPDFRKIKEAGFERFIRQPFNLTYQEYDNTGRQIEYIKMGISKGFFDVQYHGAEHLNSKRWLKALREKSRTEREAFEVRVFSPAVAPVKGYAMEYMDALDLDSEDELEGQLEYLKTGQAIFKKVWGYSPKSFVAPCYRWSSELEGTLKELGVEYIQGQRAQLQPIKSKGYKQRKKYRFTGQKNGHNQIYTVRNITFEPSLHGVEKSIETALQQIKIAFFMRVPAIVSSHRINYTSRLSKYNRNQGVTALKTLLEKLIQRYPDIVFMSSSELGDAIKQGK